MAVGIFRVSIIQMNQKRNEEIYLKIQFPLQYDAMATEKWEFINSVKLFIRVVGTVKC